MREPDGPPGAPDTGPSRPTDFAAEAGYALVSALAEGLVAVDDQGVIRVCNPAAQELLGRPASELIGSPFGHPLVGGRSTEIDLVQPGGGTRVVEMRASTTTVSGQRLHLAVLRDITLQRRTWEQLEAELDVQGTLIAVMAHEIRNPLAGIGLLIDMLRDPSEDLTADERKETLDRVADRVARLQSLADRLLTAARTGGRLPHPPREAVPVLEVALQCLADLGERSREAHVYCDAGVQVLADRGELAEMLVNYLQNAFRYGAPPIEIRTTDADGVVEIQVCDGGPGIPEEFVPELFERFTRAKGIQRHTDGSGLGLWIVRRLAQANDGEAYYRPGKPRGSCFCLRLPQAPK
ncbi:ATP-binding protein [Actinomadura sp. B10D3]|uniref:sensor histidine kinase n=1 Tax=Actinomadura sp. B10D3 TaxID=3153557 RepID=UPI00325EA002